MEIVFLGTASNNPTPVRGVSCTCFRYESEVWLFDAGEGTQIQLMKSSIKPGKINRVFVTHLHGDHIFGLPGLMCTLGQNVLESKKPVEFYGPLGLRRFLRTSLELSRSYVTYKYIVHEMVPIEEQIPEDVQKWKIVESDDTILHPSEILGNQILVNSDGYWNLFENDLVSIKAGWIKHRVATFGFVVEQKPLQGKLDVEGLKLKGVNPGPQYSKIKSGQNIQLADGSILEAANYVGPSRAGKKVTFLGDCYAVPSTTLTIAQNSDVLIHEATLEDAFQVKAISNGHSTPSMAAAVANQINAKSLILSHFSQRYKPVNYVKDVTIEGEETEMEDNVQKLIDEAKLTFRGDVIGAYDLFAFKL